MTVASNLGVAGLVAWLAVIVVGVWKSAVHLIVSRKKNDEAWVFGMVVSVAWLTTAAGIMFYGASLSLLLLFWLLFALLIRTTSDENIELSFKASPRSGLVLTFAFVILIVLSLAGWFISGTRLYSDSSLTAASAMDAGTKDDAVIRNLENALRMDPQSDTIARNLSQAYLIKIQQLFNDTKMDATAKGTQVQNLTASAIKAATAATQLGPKNISNWSQLGAVYEAIGSYVSNAPDQAIAAYQRAADLDPTSPVHPTSIGRMYLSMAGMVMNGAKDSKDEAVKAEAKKKSDDMLTRSLASLEKALSLKSDYAPASYQISIVYDAQGKIKEAVASLEKVLMANPTDIGVGYEMASLYYRDNQKDKAQSVLEEVVKQSSTFANARWLLALIYEEKQQYDNAITQIQEILKNNADNKDVQAKLQALQDEKAGKTPASTNTPATLP
jgi:tetratricopeptide (TPR) repeat protein